MNPFYDRTCNNEILKMQKLGLLDAQLGNMQGTEYCLLHVQEPILYVVRKQIRHSPTQVTPVNDYYIIAGVIYQAPDIGSVLIFSQLLRKLGVMQGIILVGVIGGISEKIRKKKRLKKKARKRKRNPALCSRGGGWTCCWTN